MSLKTELERHNKYMTLFDPILLFHAFLFYCETHTSRSRPRPFLPSCGCTCVSLPPSVFRLWDPFLLCGTSASPVNQTFYPFFPCESVKLLIVSSLPDFASARPPFYTFCSSAWSDRPTCVPDPFCIKRTEISSDNCVLGLFCVQIWQFITSS